MHVERKTVGEIGAGIELTPETIQAYMDQVRAVQAAAEQIQRILAKADRLERKAKRLPLGNGKRKALAEARRLRALVRA